jgi:hypothetical protein
MGQIVKNFDSGIWRNDFYVNNITTAYTIGVVKLNKVIKRGL